MTVLVVEPGYAPYEKTIPHELHAMQEIVGGLITAIYPYEEPVGIVANDEIVQRNTIAYKEDFDVDKEIFWNSAQESSLEHRSFLWMSRPCGTWCVPERETYKARVRNAVRCTVK